jgi:outer membrane protein TolC
MHADVATDHFQARSLDAEEHLLSSTVAQYEQALNLTQSRFKGGTASEVEVEQAKIQLQTSRAAAIDVVVLRAQYEHAVAILIGKLPAEFSLPPLPLTAPPPHIPLGLPRNCWKDARISRQQRGAWRPPMPRSELRSRLTIRRSV